MMRKSPQPDAMNRKGDLVAHAEGQTAILSAPSLVPAHLLDGGEIIILAIKPSAWYVLLTSARWIVLGLLLSAFASLRLAAWLPVGTRAQWVLWQLGFLIACGRLAWAMLDWVSRLYVLTDRRIMRIRGIFNVELFECSLQRIQNTYLTLSVGERITRTGTISVQTASSGEGASWRTVSRPLEVHEKLREAINRSQRRNGNGC